jgi:MoxR-like ATPase
VSNIAIGAEVQRQVAALEEELAGIIVGQRNIVRGVLTAVLAGGHVLLEGVPGLGKTLLVRTLAGCVDLSYSRIQFTPDLMPADIIGTDVLTEGEDGRRFTFQPGPIFAHLILADEINRATPRTQSAMLEAMQEHMVTVGRQTHHLPEPFFVLATQNPIDLQGTYPLPEAQLDRFFFKLIAGYPRPEELKEIARRTTGSRTAQPRVVLDGESLQRLQEVVRDVPIAEPVLDYAARLVMATHPEGAEAAPAARQYVRYGASPRAIQALILAGKINAILSGRYNVAYEDLRRVMLPALRHRLVLNIEAQLQNVDADAILQGILEEVKP